MVLPSTDLKLSISSHLQSDPHLIQITRKDNILSEENVSYQLLDKMLEYGQDQANIIYWHFASF